MTRYLRLCRSAVVVLGALVPVLGAFAAVVTPAIALYVTLRVSL